MKFVDEVELEVKAGDGGQPCVAFLREKYRPMGGPAGGDGGDGGDVRLRVDTGLGTLLDFRHVTRLTATPGEAGRGKSQHGARGGDFVARVPPGTLVYDARSGDLLADLRADGEEFVVARGGRGGLGNARFATSTNQAPRKVVPGIPGEERRVRLELRLLADVGLVGMPNAGKSTLIRRVSAARPKVADYPFTTLVPHLGVVRCRDERTFVLADVPGLLPGAHAGHGLGDRFLRHLSRTRLLLHLLDLSGLSGDPLAAYEQIRGEISLFDPALGERPHLVVGSKLDLAESRERLAAVRDEIERRGIEFLAVSAATGEGIDELVRRVCDRLAAAARLPGEEAPA